MARYQHLPLFQACYGFVRQAYRLKMKLPQAFRHELGSEFVRSALRVLKLVIWANGVDRKAKTLKELLLEIDSLWIFLRLLHDLKAISAGEFQEFSERLTEMGTQAQAWTKWERGRLIPGLKTKTASPTLPTG